MGYEGDKKRQYQLEWMKKRRNDWITENGPCANCGSTENLEADHIDRSQKLIHPRALWSMSLKNPRRIAELLKCQVLCNSCHIEKTKQELSIPCEKRKCERKGCKCSFCKEFKRLRIIVYRRKKRMEM